MSEIPCGLRAMDDSAGSGTGPRRRRTSTRQARRSRRLSVALRMPPPYRPRWRPTVWSAPSCSPPPRYWLRSGPREREVLGTVAPGVQRPASPWRSSAAEIRIAGPATVIGADTRDVLRGPPCVGRARDRRPGGVGRHPRRWGMRRTPFRPVLHGAGTTRVWRSVTACVQPCGGPCRGRLRRHESPMGASQRAHMSIAHNVDHEKTVEVAGRRPGPPHRARDRPAFYLHPLHRGSRARQLSLPTSRTTTSTPSSGSSTAPSLIVPGVERSRRHVSRQRGFGSGLPGIGSPGRSACNRRGADVENLGLDHDRPTTRSRRGPSPSTWPVSSATRASATRSSTAGSWTSAKYPTANVDAHRSH